MCKPSVFKTRVLVRFKICVNACEYIYFDVKEIFLCNYIIKIMLSGTVFCSHVAFRALKNNSKIMCVTIFENVYVYIFNIIVLCTNNLSKTIYAFL